MERPQSRFCLQALPQAMNALAQFGLIRSA